MTDPEEVRHLPVVAVVGRPNVGKSALVNRITGTREAIVQERPGVTRDRILHEAEWQGKPFLIVDTGGLQTAPEGDLDRKVRSVTDAAVADADLVAFVVDVTEGITAEDRDVADVVRRFSKPVVLVANKADNAKREADSAEFYELGFDVVVAVSALHGRGTGDMLDEITRGFEEGMLPEAIEPQVAIVGRPNVGKSSLFNRLVLAERSIVHDEPGTTRDAVDTLVEVDGRVLRFVDTAGLRRETRVDDATEYYGTVRTSRALVRSDLALLVVDGAEGIARQDMRIAEEIRDFGRSAIIVLNKVDLLDADDLRIEGEEIRRRLPHLDFAPLLATCALTGEGVDEIYPTILDILDARMRRVPTHLLNALVQDLQARTPIPSGTRTARIKYAVQVEAAPPVVVLFGSGRIPEQWLRYLERSIRDRFGFEGTPIHFSMRGPAPRRGSAARRGRASRQGYKGEQR